MRTATQIAEIIEQAICGCSLIQQQLSTIRENRLPDNQEEQLYLRLAECNMLINAIQFPAFTLIQQDLLADKLIGGRFLAFQQLEKEYVESDFFNGAIKFGN